jgi:integrase
LRNPNGYGGITKLPGKRRKPYRVRVTDRWEEKDGKKIQKFKTLGYYKTHKEASIELAKYHDNPGVFEKSEITFGEVYQEWSKVKFKTISKSNVNGYIASFKVCGEIENMKMSDIKTVHLQDVVDTCGKNYPMLRRLKVLYNQIYSYAMANDIVDKNYAEFVEIKQHDTDDKKTVRTPFTPDEIKTLWENVGRNEWIDTILIQIYTGLRIGELLAIKTADVHLSEKYLRGGLKTAAGKNRIIPLHDKIIPLVKNRYSEDNNLFINYKSGAVSYYTYRETYWSNVMEQLQMSHLPHDCRHTFASLAHSAGMNDLCRKRIMGHKSSDITDDVYTHKEIEELLREINKIEV